MRIYEHHGPGARLSLTLLSFPLSIFLSLSLARSRAVLARIRYVFCAVQRGTHRLAEAASFGGAVSVSVLRSQFRGNEPSTRDYARAIARPSAARRGDNLSPSGDKVLIRAGTKDRARERSLSSPALTFVDRSRIAELIFAAAELNRWHGYYSGVICITYPYD